MAMPIKIYQACLFQRISVVSCSYQPTRTFKWSSVQCKKEQDAKPPAAFNKAIVSQYAHYLEKFENKFEKSYPKVFKIYKIFKLGVKDFFADTKMYYRVSRRLWDGEKYRNFSRIELENYRQIPSDMLRSSPTLVIFFLPFIGQYAAFPLAYFFPRQLLCRHFWTPEQKIEFAQYYLSQRLSHHSKALAYLQSHSAQIKDEALQKQFKEILSQVEAGQQPSVSRLLEVQSIFRDDAKPMGLNHIVRMHKLHSRHLSHGLVMRSSKEKLLSDASLLRHIDLAIQREGLEKLSMEDLQQTCFHRGLNAEGRSREDLEHFLKTWIALSTKTDKSTTSLLLHAPSLISLNHPANAKVMKAAKVKS